MRTRVAVAISMLLLPALVSSPSAADSASHAAATMPNGRYFMPAVYDGEHAWVFGGFGGTHGAGASTSQILRFTPATGALAVAASLPTARWGMSAVWDGTHAYIFGGFDTTARSSILRFDPATGSVITLGAALPSPRFATAAAFDGQYAYIFGGHTGSTILSEVVRFDPTTGTVDQMTPLPIPIDLSSAVMADGAIFLFGGRTVGGTVLDTIYRYDPVTSAVTLLPTRLPQARCLIPVVWDGHAALLFGGSRENEETTGQILKFVPNSGAVTPLRVSLPDPRTGGAAVFAGRDSYIFGGYAPTSYRSTIVRHDALPAAPVAQAAPGASVGGITLWWTPPAANTYSGLDGYRIYRGSSPGNMMPIADVDAGTTAFEDTGLVGLQRYYYRVVGKTSYAEGSPSPTVSALARSTPPGEPTNVRVTSMLPAENRLTWEPPAAGGPIWEYRIYRGTGGNKALIASQGASSLTYGDRGCPIGQRCYYQVVAWNPEGEGPRSSEVSALWPAGNPRFQVMPGGGLRIYQDSNDDAQMQSGEKLAETPPVLP